ncbi:hypothetical protein [Nonomuraea sp. NPDC049784]|uniref:hypothetical protein n=1 Tax=Nonomuraea sp. NPDC049784 TaxID=3154361 RepID=UPI0033EA6276
MRDDHWNVGRPHMTGETIATPVSRSEGAVVLGDGDWRVTLLQFPGSGMGVRPGLISTGYLRTAEVVTVLSPPAAGFSP